MEDTKSVNETITYNSIIGLRGKNMINIVYAKTKEQAQEFVSNGYTPIECAFGDVSVVDEFGHYDHHGDYQHLPPVVNQVFNQLISTEKEYVNIMHASKFVVTGPGDADATLSILMLSHKTLPKEIKELVEVVGKRDMGDMSDNLITTSAGNALLVWKDQIYTSTKSPDFKENPEKKFAFGVQLWSDVLSDPIARMDVIQAAIKRDADRQNAAMEQANKALFRGKKLLVMDESSVPGFDVWYRDYDVVVCYIASQGRVSLGVKNDDLSKQYFGDEGLGEIFKRMGDGWGGRCSVGGSPRNTQITRDEFMRLVYIISEYMNEDVSKVA